MNDPISDMLARIRNAHMALKRELLIPKSKMKASLADILKSEGYIDDFKVLDRDIAVRLKYIDGKPIISGLKRISKPGRRVYVSAGEIPRVQNGLGICILSTSKGVLDGESAKNSQVGGELLCEVW